MSKYATDIIVGRYVIGKALKCVRAHELITVATGSSHTPPSNNTQFFLSLLLCRLNAIAIHVHFVSIWKSPSLLIFFSSSISISTVSYWYCAEFYCPFLHLVTSTTGWHQWSHPVLWGEITWDRNAGQFYVLCKPSKHQFGIPPSLLYLPLSSCSTHYSQRAI